jgi:hypothetical protein
MAQRQKYVQNTYLPINVDEAIHRQYIEEGKDAREIVLYPDM